MLVIIAHHYVVNSGLLEIVQQKSMLSSSLFLLVFGWGGKYGINCFVMITGYFMSKSRITIKKFIRLLLEIEFYNLIIYFIFLLTDYVDFSLIEFVRTILPIWGIGVGFVSSYLVFFCSYLF